MQTNLERQSWVSVFFLSIITLGIYMPFWYKKIKGATDPFPTLKKIDNRLVIGFIIITIARVPFAGHLTLNGVTYGLDSGIVSQLVGYIFLIGELVLAFQVRGLLMDQFKVKVNPVLTFLFGPLYLQSRINRILEALAMPRPQMPQTPTMSQPQGPVPQY